MMSKNFAQTIEALTLQIETLASDAFAPFIVALDGRSGVGKSTLAKALADKLGAGLIEGDDFYAGGADLRSDPVDQLVETCVDWRRLKTVLEAMKHGQTARFHPFDWAAFDGSLAEHSITAEPGKIVLLEGVYSARPEFDDLVDFAVLIRLPEAERLRRLVAREGEISAWEAQWHQAENRYFEQVVSEDRFDLVISG